LYYFYFRSFRQFILFHHKFRVKHEKFYKLVFETNKKFVYCVASCQEMLFVYLTGFFPMGNDWFQQNPPNVQFTSTSFMFCLFEKIMHIKYSFAKKQPFLGEYCCKFFFWGRIMTRVSLKPYNIYSEYLLNFCQGGGRGKVWDLLFAHKEKTRKTIYRNDRFIIFLDRLRKIYVLFWSVSFQIVARIIYQKFIMLSDKIYDF